MAARCRLEELSPEWVDSKGVERAGFVFTCPHHGPPCRLTAWLRRPGGGGQAVTETEGRLLHMHDGEWWDELSLYPPLRHGEVFVFVFEGLVVCG